MTEVKKVRARARKIQTVPQEERSQVRSICLSQPHAAEAFERIERKYKREGRGTSIELHQGHQSVYNIEELTRETNGDRCGDRCYLVDCVPSDLKTTEQEVRV